MVSGRRGAGHNALLALLRHEPLQSWPRRTEQEARAERTQEEEQKTGAAGGWAGIPGGRGTGTHKGRFAERLPALPAPSFHTGKNLGARGEAAAPGRSDSRSLWSRWFQFVEWISAVKPLPCPGIRLCLPVVLEISTSAGSETSYRRSPIQTFLQLTGKRQLMPYVLGHVFGRARRGCDPAFPPTPSCCCPDPRCTAGALRAGAGGHQNSSGFLARADNL